MTTTDWEKQFSKQAKRTSPPEISWLMSQALEVPGLISLAAGFVDQASLPHSYVSEQIRVLLESPTTGRAALQYGTTQGDFELRSRLLERLRTENVFHAKASIDASHFIVGSGSQQILYLVAEALLEEEDIVLVEAPTYFVVLGAMKTRGACTIGIDTDEEGIQPKQVAKYLQKLEFENQLHRVKVLYLMSYATNPLGITLSPSRRKELFSILRDYRDKGYPILLIEDAAYRRLSFEPTPPPPLKSLDKENDLILYTESFSKSLAPGMRLGFGVGPKALIDKMVDLKGNHDFGSSNFSQQILKQVMQSGLFEQHLEYLRSLYAQKRDLVEEILTATFPQEARWITPKGGFYTWVTLPSSFDTGPQGKIFQRALEEKVLYVPGCLCYSSDRPEHHHSSSIRISFGMIDNSQLQEGCKRLARTLHQFTATPTS